jgi:hypothetical protein
MGPGAGSSNVPLQGQIGGTLVPLNAFPYAGGHIPPSSPLLGGPHQQSARQPAHTSLFGAGSQETPVHSMPVGSTPFVWNMMFGNNNLSSTTFPSGGNPIFGQSTPTPGEHIAGPWKLRQGSIPSSRMSFWGNSFHSQWNPGQTTMPLPSEPAWGNHS